MGDVSDDVECGEVSVVSEDSEHFEVSEDSDVSNNSVVSESVVFVIFVSPESDDSTPKFEHKLYFICEFRSSFARFISGDPECVCIFLWAESKFLKSMNLLLLSSTEIVLSGLSGVYRRTELG